VSFGYGIAALLLAPRGSEQVFLKRRPARCPLAGVQNAGRGGRLPSSNIIASNAAQARMKKPRPTNDRGSAWQTIWCRYASGIAGSMAPFSAKRKGRQSFAPRFVYPPKVQIKPMRGKLLSTSRVSCHRLPPGREVLKRGAGDRPFPTGCFILCPSRTMASWARSQEAAFIQPSTGKQKETAMFGKHKTQAVKDPAGDLAGDLDAAIGFD
jgi:hypothetical protein